jgi:hypothetical protein
MSKDNIYHKENCIADVHDTCETGIKICLWGLDVIQGT